MLVASHGQRGNHRSGHRAVRFNVVNSAEGTIGSANRGQDDLVASSIRRSHDCSHDCLPSTAPSELGLRRSIRDCITRTYINTICIREP